MSANDSPQNRDVEATIQRAFGLESRRRMLDEYFTSAGEITSSNAWQHVYRLLLWIDRTTGLAHCYESDKAQPGRPWYARSLAFHAWVSEALEIPPALLETHIDWLFRRGMEQLVSIVARQQALRSNAVAEQRAPYIALGLPEPGQDQSLERLILDELGEWLTAHPPMSTMQRITQRIRAYLTQENKRKNLVGEGFEDVLAFLIQRLPGAAQLNVTARPVLHSLPGFRTPPGTEKPRKVDLAITGPGERRILVSAKWSVRADREEQFGVDLEAYARLEDAGRDFDFVLVTNEFDAARLAAACERRRQNAALFTTVVHVNPHGPQAAYAESPRGAALKLGVHIHEGRLKSLEQWFATLTT